SAIFQILFLTHCSFLGNHRNESVTLNFEPFSGHGGSFGKCAGDRWRNYHSDAKCNLSGMRICRTFNLPEFNLSLQRKGSED
ncbi:MAG: hypothetical protein QNJ46_10700, partial [Leptolyngbyaceae cyanobacterium MO_188.B28]|nr:hypothetical protein [Leptolyngbyaceae cyanobacterium MO_188.B28]